jgi:tetratricopeptide (TPR) repeat protein
MIVRNEAAIVGRCLESLSGLIDSWVICDTGSVDRTQEIVRASLAGLPGELHQAEWEDFGHNRSQLMELASGSADYLLLIDADMTVQQNTSLPRLDADAYALRETGGAGSGVLRLVRGDRRWWYEGSVHDYIATDGRVRQRQLDGLVVNHHRDGTSRREKLLRDLGLLKRDIVRKPDLPRTLFHLAQTYRALGRHEAAIRYYRRRAELGGWDEELFYANLQLGAIGAMKNLREAIPVLLATSERWAARAEPLYELARAHRRRDELATAHMFATRGLDVPLPSDAMLVHPWVYDWGLRLERARAAEGLGRLEEARADLRELLETEPLPRAVEAYVRGSLGQLLSQGAGHSRQPRRPAVARLDSLAASVRVGEIKLKAKPDWPGFNPSIARDADGFRIIVRTANYQIEKGVLHRDGIQHNINYLVSLDGELAVRGVEPIVDRSSGAGPRRAEIHGYEDCRLIEVDGCWYATATACDLNPAGRREMVLLHLEGPQVTSAKRLEGLLPGRHEKNWMPFVIDGSLHAVYTCGPTIVLRCDPSTGDVEVVRKSLAPRIAAAFRGGSQGIEVDGGHLFVVHEVDRGERLLRYMHRFVLLGEDLALAAISSPFSFTLDRIEFCAGMALANDELVMSFGVSDAAAGLATISLDEALLMLEPASPQTDSTGRRVSETIAQDRLSPAQNGDARFPAVGVALGAAVVWTSPFPFADAAIGQTIPSSRAALTRVVLTAGLNRYIADLTGHPPEPPCSLDDLAKLLNTPNPVAFARPTVK